MSLTARIKRLERLVSQRVTGPCRHCGSKPDIGPSFASKPSLAEGYALHAYDAASTPTDDLGVWLTGLAEHERHQLAQHALGLLQCGRCKRVNATTGGPKAMHQAWAEYELMIPADREAEDAAYLASLQALLGQAA